MGAGPPAAAERLTRASLTFDLLVRYLLVLYLWTSISWSSWASWSGKSVWISFRMSLNGELWFGAYADGAQEAVEYELNLVETHIVASHSAASALVFFFQNSQHTIGSIETLFRLFSPRSYRIQECSFSLDSLTEVIHEIVSDLSSTVKDKILNCTAWRISGIRKDTAQERQNFKSSDIEVLTANAIQSALLAQGHFLPPVSLKQFDLEIILYVRGGIMAMGWADDEVRGLRASNKLIVGKGADILSKAQDHVAFILASFSLLLSESRCNLAGGEIRCCDPMCGVGTCLFALAFLVSSHFPTLRPLCFGMDKDERSIHQAKANLERTKLDSDRFRFFHCACEEMSPKAREDIPLNSIDIAIVDPPWGHRHGSFAQISRQTLRWARQWVAMLRPEVGVLLVTTIRTRHLEQEVLPVLQRELGAELIRPPSSLNNGGFFQCKLFALRKTRPTTQVAQPAPVSRAPPPRAVAAAGPPLVHKNEAPPCAD